MKTLKDLLYKVAIEGTSGTPSVRVNSLSFDSRTIKKGGLFIAQKGVQLDGHDYISHAIDNGAQAVVCESLPKEREDGVTYVVVANASRALGIIASNFFDKPSEKLKLIGIT